MDKIKLIPVRFLKKVFFLNLSRILSIFYKKNYNLWVFGERAGVKFNGNSKYFYLHMLKSHPEIKSVWFTRSKSVYNEVKAVGGIAYMFYSFNALILGLKAGVYIISHGSMYDIGNYSIDKSLIICLWHGVPVKMMPHMERPTNSFLKNLFDKLTHTELNNKWDMLVSTSEMVKMKWKEIFPQNENIPITGEPRDTIFFRTNNKDGFFFFF